MRITDKRAIVLVENLFEDHELIYPYYRLLEAGAETRIVGPEEGRTYQGKSGTKATSGLAARDVEPGEWDVLIIPGGYAPDHMRRHRSMVDLVRKMHDKDKVVAAICHAGWMLASAGILKGRRVTSFFAIKDDLVHAGARWEDKEAVTDGNLVTSRKPDDLPDFMRSILELLAASR
ncbi:MAG: type 1 glutamine amidotransferase [Desulfohalobiaceae bacterium]|nr:type 1 glutamine amidotransferase [Desulfohalobiaceae bacterium]